jgi:TRAP-type uncharacterized transport system substrate-binding protein
MRRWRMVGPFGAAAAAVVLGVVILGVLVEFLAPDLSYQFRDRASELLSGQRGRRFRIALGSATGSSYRVGEVLNRYLKAGPGYELELVVTSSPGNVGALLDRNEHIDLAVINSADDNAVKADGVYGLAALDPQYFFVIVPEASPVREFRDLTGPVNPGVREAGQPATLGERVLEYYGMISAVPTAAGVTIVRPKQGNLADFQSGHMTAATRTQFLHAGLIEEILIHGGYRLVSIRDHEALARSIPGTKAGFIPAGLYGPGRRIPAEPVPTLTVTQLLVARGDLPGRVARDILEVIYHPRFARDLQYEVSEASGRMVGGLPLHPAAEFYYHRNDLLTAERLGRFSLVASVIAAFAATIQFLTRLRRRTAARRRLDHAPPTEAPAPAQDRAPVQAPTPAQDRAPAQDMTTPPE